jgi:hypothetical protein
VEAAGRKADDATFPILSDVLASVAKARLHVYRTEPCALTLRRTMDQPINDR